MLYMCVCMHVCYMHHKLFCFDFKAFLAGDSMYALLAQSEVIPSIVKNQSDMISHWIVWNSNHSLDSLLTSRQHSILLSTKAMYPLCNFLEKKIPLQCSISVRKKKSTKVMWHLTKFLQHQDSLTRWYLHYNTLVLYCEPHVERAWVVCKKCFWVLGFISNYWEAPKGLVILMW